MEFNYKIHTHAQKQEMRGGEVRRTRWMVCHRGNGQLTTVDIVQWYHGNCRNTKGAKQRKQQKEGDLISKLAKEEF